jgi:Holliday junction resolvasome RuvABC endonuclease subunit
MQRYLTLCELVLTHVRRVDPVFVCIEGYSFASKGGQAFDRVEYGGILRMKLMELTRVAEVSPLSLKLFTAGTAMADKTKMALALFKSYGLEFGSDDEADAYALARFAACLDAPAIARNDGQRRAVDGILHPKVKKPRKRKDEA